jgi:hypothetical protein
MAEETDGMFCVSLRHLAKSWAFYGEERLFGNLTVHDVPRPQVEALCACLSGMSRGMPVACPEWAQKSAIDDLVELVCRTTVAYALQDYEFPDKINNIYYGHYGRAAPGPGFIGIDGPIENYERGRWPPDLWFSVMHMVARLTPKSFHWAAAAIPKNLPDWSALFRIADGNKVCSVDESRNFADVWTTMPWRGVSARGGDICVTGEDELSAVLAHVRRQKATAEQALGHLARCLQDEHNLVWKLPKNPGANTGNP